MESHAHTAQPVPPSLLRPQQAAALLGLSVQTLAKYRLTGDGPPFVKVGPRVVAYRLDALEAWIVSRTRRSTSDRGEDAA